jgi:hypothetical protein
VTAVVANDLLAAGQPVVADLDEAAGWPLHVARVADQQAHPADLAGGESLGRGEDLDVRAAGVRRQRFGGGRLAR